MGRYATQLTTLKVYKALEAAAGRDGIDDTDVRKLVGMVCAVADRVGPDLERIPQTFRQYTNHDIGHSRNVAHLMGCFIPEATLDQLNGLELSLLICAALLHDAGMVVSDQEKASVLASGDFQAFLAQRPEHARGIEAASAGGHPLRGEAIRDAVLAEYFRGVHPERSAGYVRAHVRSLLAWGDYDLTEEVAVLSESHGWGVWESRDLRSPERSVGQLPDRTGVGGARLNLRYLACCLRLADVMDFDRSRTPLSVFEQIDFTEPQSWGEWSKHLQIRHWDISEHEVVFQAQCTHPAFYVAVHQFLTDIDAELQACRYLMDDAPARIAGRYQLHLPLVVDRRRVRMKDQRYIAGDFRFQLEYDEIVRLLMDKALYPQPDLFLRELLQNSLDACRHKEALWKERAELGQVLPPWEPRIVVWDYSGDRSDRRVAFQDNGMGMSLEIVRNYFMRVGRSYYRSAEFQGERRRLEEQGIDIEACSRFGIGILSCFLVCDRFEIETYREGYEPLHVTIEGPSRYFVIRRLPKPDPSTASAPPASDQQDGPPARTGTRIVVHLRREQKVDVLQTVATFAANVDYPVEVQAPGGPTKVIRSRKFERKRGDVLTDVEIPARLHDKANRHALQEVLHASAVPFADWPFSRHIRGSAWLWLLRGPSGELTPRWGYLRVTDGLELTGPPGFVGLVEGMFEILPDDLFWRRLVTRLRDCVESGAWPELDLEPDDMDAGRESWNALMDTWGAMSPAERAVALRAAEERQWAQDCSWIEVAGLPAALVQKDLAWVDKSISMDPSGLRLRGPHALACSGILVPQGLYAGDVRHVYWRPRTRLLCVAGGYALDVRGHLAPRLPASRLFIDMADAQTLVVPFVRALIRHAVWLIEQSSDPAMWTEWWDLFRPSGPLSSASEPLEEYIHTAWRTETTHIRERLGPTWLTAN